MIILDASVLIAHLDADDVHNERAAQLLEKAAPDGLGASPLTLAEVLVAPARAGRLDQALAAIKTLGVATVTLTPDAPERLARLRAVTNLTLPDCCVLFAAASADAIVASFDERLIAEAEKLGLSILAH